MWCGSSAESNHCGVKKNEIPAEKSEVALSAIGNGYELLVKHENPLVRLAGFLAEKTLYALDNFNRYIALHPKPARRILLAICFIMIATMFTVPAGANSVMFNVMESEFRTNTSGWMLRSLNIANMLFLFLAGLTLFITMTRYAIEHNSVRGVFATLMKTLFSMMIPYLILEWSPIVLGNLSVIADELTNGITGRGYAIPNIDSFYQHGIGIGWGLLTDTLKTLEPKNFHFDYAHPFDSFGANFEQYLVDFMFILIGLVLAIILVVTYTFIAVEVLLAKLEVLFALPLGAWALGFMGAPATSSIAMRVWGGILKSLVRFVAIYAAAIMADHIATTWKVSVDALGARLTSVSGPLTATATSQILQAMVGYAIGGLALLYFVRKLGAIAAGIIDGNPGMTGGGLVTTGAMVAGGAALAAANSAAGAAAGSGIGAIRGAVEGAMNGTGAVSGAFGGSLRGAVRGGMRGASGMARNAMQNIMRER